MKPRLAFCIVGALAALPVLASCTSSSVSPNEAQWDRARMACEQVGLRPGSSEVSDCTANLQSALNNTPL